MEVEVEVERLMRLRLWSCRDRGSQGRRGEARRKDEDLMVEFALKKNSEGVDTVRLERCVKGRQAGRMPRGPKLKPFFAPSQTAASTRSRRLWQMTPLAQLTVHRRQRNYFAGVILRALERLLCVVLDSCLSLSSLPTG